MKLHTSLCALLLATTTLSSCSDFLEGKSQDLIMVKTATDFGELLLGSGYPKTDFGIVETMSDDIDWMVDRDQEAKQATAANESFLAQFCWQPYIYEYGTKVAFPDTEYFKLYALISSCNAVLDGIDEAIGVQYDRDRIKAEALAVRAYHYFTLVNLYGQPYNMDKKSPGVPIKLTAAIQEEGQPRNTVEEVYDLVTGDLKAAIELLKPYKVTEQDYRINLPAIHTLLGRVYLYMEEWKLAAEQATAALNINGKLCDLTTIKADEGFIANSYASPEVYWNFGNGLYGTDYSQFSDAFKALAYANPNDLRFGEEKGETGIYLRPTPHQDYTTWPTTTVYDGKCSIIKTQNTPTIGSISLPGLSIRSSEAYLTRAEAYAEQGLDDEALEDLNKLRRNRIAGYQDVTKADVDNVLEAVRNERRLEFCFEGFRWFDLRRYGMPRIVHRIQIEGPEFYYILKEKDPMYTLPIPSKIMELNPALVQNPSADIAFRSAVTTY